MQNLTPTPNNVTQNLATADRYSLTSPSLSPAQGIGFSGTHKIVPKAVTLYCQSLQSDVQQFVQETLYNRSANVIISPLLVKTTEQITARVMNEAGLKGDAIESEPNRLNIKNTAEGIHIQSKRVYVDQALARLQIPHTTSAELRQKGYEQATAELNAQITKDTQGMITDFLDAGSLENPNLAFRLVTWLLQHLSWREPFELMDGVNSSAMTWNKIIHPEIQWMESSNNTSSITHINSEGYDFVAVPVEERGIKAVLVLPPQDATDQNSEDLNRVLTDGLTLILGKTKEDQAKLTLPKFTFDYQFTTEYPGALASGTHKAALTIDEQGAQVAAASCMMVSDCFIPHNERLQFNFDRPFYFAMINQQNAKDPRVVGMARINQPWK
ncbi:serpin family protein [Endozoicomonas sp. SCSIO W0465]|uniref:serpin family protein n=1 Tax=Endozoicomonas sp. SCSIO W0465 TaxID=2918516 RepID=UPI0020750AFB|nr:serpin family protein [Endozoicomonas sp. SCSIO W0465]USE36060.1 hypothetical protein MJO57_29110 [Endozoicomonas sp. SCSIO W0465]